MIFNYAHRGASGDYPENTMLAFEKAIAFGCDGIETDVQMTRDLELVLIHDEKLERTTGASGMVKDYTLSEIKKLSAGENNEKEFASVQIPTAEELILLAKKNNIKINFELKNGIVMYPNMEKKLIELIYKHDMQKQIILSSFNHYSMVACKGIAAEIKTGLLYMEGLYRPEVYCTYVGADGLHPYYIAINNQIIKDIKAQNKSIYPFTVDDEEQMRSLILRGVDGIITNYPNKLKRIIESIS